jgi:cytochrome c-type biogenesis protein CcmH/NrfF
MTDEEIYTRLEREFGPGIRAVPQDDASILVWIVPGLVLGAGLVLASIVTRRWSRDETQVKSAGGLDSPTADDRRRLEAELSRFQERLWWRR